MHFWQRCPKKISAHSIPLVLRYLGSTKSSCQTNRLTNTVGAWIQNIGIPNTKEYQKFWSSVFQWSKNKMVAILFCFPIVQTIGKPNFWLVETNLYKQNKFSLSMCKLAKISDFQWKTTKWQPFCQLFENQTPLENNRPQRFKFRMCLIFQSPLYLTQ